MPTINKSQPNKDLSSYCGLFCGSCIIYKNSSGKQSNSQKYSKKIKSQNEQLTCGGCRSENKSMISHDCKISACAKSKKVNSCCNCPAMPCDQLIQFQKEMAHRVDILNSLKLLHNEGYEKWNEKMIKDYSCAICGILNAYTLRCPQCGHYPGNPFVSRNEKKIKKQLGI